MRTSRVAGQALNLAAPSAHHPYICRACLASTRQFSTSDTLSASSEPFYKRIQTTLFGNKESRAADEKREAARKKQLEGIKASEEGGGGGTGGEQGKKIRAIGGKEFRVAKVVDPSTHEGYVVSRDWKGLERVGGEEWVRRRADSGEKYVGFMSPTQVKLDRGDWEVLLHTVTAEVLTLRKAGRDVLQVCNARIPNEEEGEHPTVGVVVSDKDGAAVLQAEDKQEKAILASIPETAQEEPTRETLELELAEALTSGGGKIFMDFKLDDPLIKFAILKRTMQLTGKRIPDILLSNATTLDHLHRAFATKETPNKLHDTEQLQKLMSGGDVVPNVQVHDKRRTHVHKDKEIGRWKLIEDELALRNMPTSGGSRVSSERDV